MLYKKKPQIVLIAVSIEGEDLVEPRFIAGKSVEEVLSVIDAAFPAAEPQSVEEPKKARRPRRTKAEMARIAADGTVEIPDETKPGRKPKDAVWPG